MSTYDVVVVGGRVAGAGTAMLLARSGLRVALLERGSYGSDTLSTHGFMRAGVLQLSRWGILSKIVATGTPPVQRTTFHYPDAPSVQISIRESPGVPALFAPRRHLLDRTLVDAAAEAGVDVRHGTAVTGLLHGRDGAVQGVRVAGSGGRTEHLHSWLTVGADGVRSTVAAATGASVQRSEPAGGAVLFRYHADFPATGYEWAYGPGAAAGLLPTNDGLTCVFVATTRDRMRAARRDGVEQAFHALFATAAPAHVDRLEAASPVGRMYGWTGVPGHLRQPWGPGWALVGDASYFKDPITAHGMTDALRDAELLSSAVVEVASGAADPRSAFDDYQHQRDRLSHHLFAVSHRLAEFDTDLDRVRRLLREASAAMTDEVEHLETLPARPASPRRGASVGADSAPARE